MTKTGLEKVQWIPNQILGNEQICWFWEFEMKVLKPDIFLFRFFPFPLLFLFSFSLSFHVFLSNQFARAPNSESYEFIIRPCCVIEGVFNFMQMISNSSILGSKFWKENWGLIFEAFWKSFETKKKERKRKLSRCIRIENNRHLDCRKCFSVSLSVDFIRSVACTVNDKILQIGRTAKFCNQLS